MARILFRCPYGHDSEFTDDSRQVNAQTFQNILICTTCGRHFVMERTMIDTTSWTDPLVVIQRDTLVHCFEEHSEASERQNPRIKLDYGGERIKYWGGHEFTFISAED